jgi:hypothetical protein
MFHKLVSPVSAVLGLSGQMETKIGEGSMTEDQIKHMANRFLNWKLPDGFNPDGGISFEKIGNKGTPHEYTREPVGTNLIGYTEAVAMVRHMLEDLPKSA